MPGKRIVIIGAGSGGIVLANALRRKVDSTHRIIVIERSDTHAFPPSFLWLMVGERKRSDITRPVRSLLASGVELLIGEAREIDPAERLVRVGSESIGYDFLVLAGGAELKFGSTPGLERAETFFTVEGAERLYEALREFPGGRVAVVVEATPYKCPGAPAEGSMLIRDFLRQKGVQGSVDLYTPEPAPMPVAGPELGAAVRTMLEDRGVGYHPLHSLVSASAGKLTFEGREPVSADLVVTIPRHAPLAIARTAGVANDAGWAPADPRTLATRDASIFAIGDCASIPLPGMWKPNTPLMLPKAGVFAHAQALTLAGRIAARILGGPAPEFCGDGFCMLEAGEHLAGFAYGDFYATPSPKLELHNVGKTWHLSKVLFEKWWLAGPGLRRSAYSAIMHAGAKVYGIDLSL
jgi:sulfide:quinone oxidoreductase